LVSIGTSLPELATVVYASATGEGGIAFGDIVGANITNITMVLGLGAVLVGKIPIPKTMIRRDSLILVGVFGIFFLLCQFGGGAHKSLSRFDGAILLFIFVAYVIFLLATEKSDGEEEENVKFKSMFTAFTFFLLGLLMVFIGAKFMVDNVVWIAESFNVPKALIAATIVALGTTVPELAVTITGVMKKQHAIALGNILGSCIINIVMILGVASLIRPLGINSEMIFSIILLFILGILLTVAMFTGSRLTRKEGAVFLSLYLLFWGYNIYKTFAGKGEKCSETQIENCSAPDSQNL
jgi:cation:H+ antiporter